LLAIRSHILQRARNHTNIAIIKVKSHTGIHGNDLADLGANVARSLPTKCDYSCAVQPEHFIHLPGWPCLPMDQDDAEEPWFAPDLNASLKKHMFDNCRHITDGSRASTSLTYAKIQHLVDKSLPIYFTALWTMGLPFSQTRNILKTLTNTLWTAKKAQQMNKPYKSAAGVITNGHCPLCSHPNDTPGHILGGCDHPTFKGCYIARHNQATCTLNTAIDTGRLGACFTIMDVTSTDNLPFGVFDSRIPRWMVPAIPPHFPPDFDLKKLRPDILKVEGLPHTDFLQLQAAGLLYCDTTMTTLKSKCIIHPFEVGYTSEFSHSSCLASKQQQHVLLIELFQYNGWTVFTTPVPPLSLPHLHLHLPPSLLSHSSRAPLSQQPLYDLPEHHATAHLPLFAPPPGNLLAQAIHASQLLPLRLGVHLPHRSLSQLFLYPLHFSTMTPTLPHHPYRPLLHSVILFFSALVASFSPLFAQPSSTWACPLQWSIQPSTLFRAMPSTSIALSFVTVVDLKAPSHLFAPCYMTHRDPSVFLFLVCTSPQVPYSLSHASRGVFFLSFHLISPN
jgi:hypothetical protein